MRRDRSSDQLPRLRHSGIMPSISSAACRCAIKPTREGLGCADLCIAGRLRVQRTPEISSSGGCRVLGAELLETADEEVERSAVRLLLASMLFLGASSVVLHRHCWKRKRELNRKFLRFCQVAEHDRPGGSRPDLQHELPQDAVQVAPGRGGGGFTSAKQKICRSVCSTPSVSRPSSRSRRSTARNVGASPSRIASRKSDHCGDATALAPPLGLISEAATCTCTDVPVPHQWPWSRGF